MAWSVVHEDARDGVETEPIMRDIAGAASDARRLVRKGLAGPGGAEARGALVRQRGYWAHITPHGEMELSCWSHTGHGVKRDRERAAAQGMQF